MTLNDLQLYKENNKYYLSAMFFHEDKKGYYEVSIPKIKLPVSQDCAVNFSSRYDDYHKPYKIVDVDFGFGILFAEPFDDECNFLTMKCIEEKVHPMTLAEIEKELGYKIELKETNS